ncbi:integrase [Sinorhizobium fredii]|jgi:integrase|uniref:Integrase family protein n=1 Tax=Sinorhizobium fredii (strain USDA 257) TaxID=1185652 RepID=I3XA09_SINF2|nr:tyrosine-type recombinase/integrase [Sinorhizobium fredii]AFL52715.1 integrase family protein [Sinorhizobium fredii USDA 257]
MGSIVERKRRNGQKSYTAQIRIMREGVTVHSEAQTFERRPAAAAWLKKRETQLAEPGALDKLKEPQSTLADAIDRYVKESKKEIGRTKAQVLEKVKEEFNIAKMSCNDIGSAEIVEFATELSKGRKPQTVGNYISHLASIFAIARPAWKIDLDYSAMEDAQVVLKRLGLVAKSAQRDRRPTLEELDRLMEHYSDRETRYPSLIPMRRLIAFAIFSTRRQEEISRIAWSDYEEDNKRVLVRDMKNPGEKIGNDVWCDLPPEAMRIIGAMPRGAPEIFPHDGRSVSASFTRACNLLEIEDLHFHDLRHEGVSRLFELGWNIPHVATVSGHRSWNSLKRYSHIKQRGDKYEGWKWLDIIAPTRIAG